MATSTGAMDDGRPPDASPVSDTNLLSADHRRTKIFSDEVTRSCPGERGTRQSAVERLTSEVPSRN